MSSSPNSIDDLIRSIVAQGILSEVSLRDELASAANPPETIPQLVTHLVNRGMLTPYQGHSLEQGNIESLVLGNYAILDRLGAGGMGEVFRAKHRRMGRVVALKVMTAESTFGPQAAERFDREVRAAAKLSHPNIVTAFDSDESRGRLFLVMEYLAGSDLDTCLRSRGVFTPEQSVEIMLQAARGLEYAHQHGVIHRDIKPSNLLLTTDGVVKLMDLGLARLDEPRESQNQSTAPDVVFGTPDFMAPEQCLGAKYADHRSDIYSLGCTWYTITTGRPIYDGENKVQKILAHREGVIPTLRSAGASEAVDAVFKRMVAKWPEERYQSATDLVAGLSALAPSGTTVLLSGISGFTPADASAPTIKRNAQPTPASPSMTPADTPAALPPGLLRPQQPATAAPSVPRPSRRKLLFASLGALGAMGAGLWATGALGGRRGELIDMLADLSGAQLPEGWTLDGGVLECADVGFHPGRQFPSEAASVIEIGPVPYGDIELQMTIERLGGAGPLIVGIPTMHAGWGTFVADSQTQDHKKGDEEKKGPRKGPSPSELGPPPPRRPPDVPLEGPTSIMAVVREGGSVLDCNGRRVAQLPWDPMTGVTHRVQSPVLFLASLGSYRVSRITVQHLMPPFWFILRGGPPKSSS